MPQHSDAAGTALSHEYIAIRRSADYARPGQAVGEQLDSEAGRDDRLLIGPLHDSDHVGDGLFRLRRRQIVRLDQTAHAWPVGVPIAERGAALKNAGRRLRQERHGCETKHAGKA